LKKWVIRKSAAKLPSRPWTSFSSGIVEVLLETIEPGLAHGIDGTVDLLLDVDPLEDGLDDPVAVGEQVEVVLEVAGGDEPARRSENSGAGFVFLSFSIADLARTSRSAGPSGHDVEQHHRHAGVGDVGGDAGAHDTGAEHADLADLGLGASRSDRLEDRRDALAAADALGGEGVALGFAREQRRRLAGDAGAGGAQRVAERDGAAVEVDLGDVEAELVDAGQRLRSERLVELDDVDVARASGRRARAPCASKRPGRCP
jgi:hypothetical protein